MGVRGVLWGSCLVTSQARCGTEETSIKYMRSLVDTISFSYFRHTLSIPYVHNHALYRKACRLPSQPVHIYNGINTPSLTRQIL
ncbi:hypothetical protein QBC40DRAFT_279856 [Triangularia verruculosa]|uniref:Uncharacterized protein n=1 Tax=Triangularia verruculosa TaxID=2587418 RepID=A0AAN7AX28_9PEZI|nr:hypothetical protein QBC40DRAFT_279856 [Triangularia verruculosa]